MDKKILVVVILIVLAIGGGTFYLLNSSPDNTAMQETTTESEKQTPSPTSATAPDSTANPDPTDQPASNADMAGVYKDYSSSVIVDTSGTKLLFFHAPWCPQCRDLEADIKQKGVPSGVAIIKVDYDSNQSLRQKYGVTLQTTLVRVDDQGKFVKKYVSYDEPNLESVKRNLL